jgi:hypothetical protein
MAVDLLCGLPQRRERGPYRLHALVVQAGQERGAVPGALGHQVLHQL